MSFDLSVYQSRIGLAARPTTTLAGLRQLQCAHMGAIAQENVTQFLGETPDFSAQGLWDKLVVERRGGSPMALNRLLGSALHALSFVAKPVLARTALNASPDYQDGHLAWLVTAEERSWLVDAGLGEHSPTTPILESREPQASGGSMFRVIVDGNASQKVLQRKIGESWKTLCSYDDAEFTPAAWEEAKTVHAREARKRPASNLIVSIHRPNGRLSIINRCATSEADFGTRNWVFPSYEAFAQAIRTTFMLNYSDEELVRVWTATSAGEQQQAA